jgi:16S rRNA (uracil1498-N3)-methyltransferase
VGQHEAPLAEVAVRAAAATQVFVTDVAIPVLDPAAHHHLARVLRLVDGESVVAADGRGHWRLCAFVRRAGDPAGTLEVTGPVNFEPPPAPALTVAFAPAKGERPEWVVQKLTELGVDRIVPIHSDHSVVRWAGARAERSVARLRTVAEQAAAQCRRVWLPEVTELDTLVGLAARPGGVALAQLGGAPPSLERPAVAVGPEGGWSAEELAGDLPRVSAGPGVLRSETAAVAVGALLGALRAGTVVGNEHHNGAGDLGGRLP